MDALLADLIGLLLSPIVSVAHAAEPGMPQLNPKTMATQVFWVLLSFGVLYWVMSRVALPKLGRVLDARAERIDGDIAAAQQARTESDRVQSTYTAVLEKARGDAANTVRSTLEAVNKEVVRREMDAAQKAVAEAKAIEARIAAAQRTAMVNVSVIARDVAGAAVERLTGGGADEASVAAAVSRALEQRR